VRIAVLVKQIPKFEEMELGADGRLKRAGIELELNPYCRRAVSQAVELAAARLGSNVTVITLGPPTAEDSLREAIAWGLEHGVDIDGVLVTDPAFAGSDTLATAYALNAALDHEGPFDLVLTGRNSVDADTGQVGPELAELCDLPFLSGVRHLSIDGRVASARCEHDDGWLQAEVDLPAILSCAERLIEPAKVDPPGRAAVAPHRPDQPLTVVVAEPDRLHDTRELLGAAAALTGDVLVVTCSQPLPPDLLSSWGADTVTHLDQENIEEEIADAVVRLVQLIQAAPVTEPWAILVGSTAWGREVASRIAARLGAGLTGDAVELQRVGDRLVAWKPAFGGQLVAAIHCSSPVQMATVRAGVLPTLNPREPGDITEASPFPATLGGRVRILARTRDDDLDVLAEAHTVIGIGQGVSPDAYDDLEPLRTVLDAQLGATRKVTDKGWLPRSRQIGITGRSIAPRLFVSIGASGKFNHTVGLRAAGTVLAINTDPEAPIFDAADIGIVGDWRDALPMLVEQLRAARA
jgi:electron transfer flavoprotein alpha subunit